MRRTLYAVLAAVALAPLAAHAATATATFTVTATVTNVCKIAVPANVTFAAFDVTGPAQTATNTVNVNCTKGAAYNVTMASANSWTLNAGAPSTDKLPYVIYQPDASGNAAQTTAWDATHAWAFTSTSNATKALVMTVKVSPADVAAGSYTDTVTATVNF